MIDLILIIISIIMIVFAILIILAIFDIRRNTAETTLMLRRLLSIQTENDGFISNTSVCMNCGKEFDSKLNKCPNCEK